MSDILMHAIKDSYPIFPFLFLVYCILGYLESKKALTLNKLLHNLKKVGPIFASFLGLLPHCGFSIAAVNLYVDGTISIGTLISLFIATSDEALIVLLGYPNEYKMIAITVILKIVIGCSVGVIVDMIYSKKETLEVMTIENRCCHQGHDSIIKSAFHRSLKIILFIFITNFLLSAVIHMIGEEILYSLFMQNKFFQPFLAALFGFIPNCVSSVILTQLYVSGVIQYGSLLAGVITNAGLGLLILYRIDRKKHTLFIVFSILFLTACFSGYMVQLFF